MCGRFTQTEEKGIGETFDELHFGLDHLARSYDPLEFYVVGSFLFSLVLELITE